MDVDPTATTDPDPDPVPISTPTPRPVWRSVGAAALVVAGLATWLATGLLGSAATEATADALPRARLGEAIEVEVHPGTWNVYLEGPAAVTAVRVRDADGDVVEVDLSDREGYTRQGARSTIVGSFVVPRGGATDYVVTTEGRGEVGADPRATVGPADAFDFATIPTGLTIAAISIDLLAAALVVVAPRFGRAGRRRPR